MNKGDVFDISFESGGKKYSGWVNPSGKLDAHGKSSSFHVILNNILFGNLSLNKCHWTISESRPHSLVEKVGMEIEKHDKL
jgi:hypothetical protein